MYVSQATFAPKHIYFNACHLYMAATTGTWLTCILNIMCRTPGETRGIEPTPPCRRAFQNAPTGVDDLFYDSYVLRLNPKASGGRVSRLFREKRQWKSYLMEGRLDAGHWL